MFTKQELSSIKNKLESVQNELKKKSEKSDNKLFKQSCKSMNRTIQTSLDNLEDIKSVQDEQGIIKKFDDL